jgi:hypothetical protein
MARHVPTASHYAARHVVWFPPSYYLPSDEDSFASLIAAYPKAFCLATEGQDYRVYFLKPEHGLPSEKCLREPLG